MYQAHSVAAADGKNACQLLRAVAEPAGGDDHRAGGDGVVPDGDPHDRSVVDQQSVDTAPERDIDALVTAVPCQHVDDGLPPPDRAVDPRHPLVAAEHELVVELHAEVAQPLDGRSGPLAQAAGRRRPRPSTG